MRFLTKSLELQFFTTLPFLLFANLMSMMVMRMEGSELSGSWKTYSTLNEKYNSSFFIFANRTLELIYNGLAAVHKFSQEFSQCYPKGIR